MNINERLIEIEEGLDNDFHGRLIMHEEPYQWMRDTIKQLQEENTALKHNIEEQKYTLKLQNEVIDENEKVTKSNYERMQKRIAELEKEKQEITAAHEAFLKELQEAIVIMKHNDTCRLTLEEVEQSYNKHFSDIHLAEQVRQAKLSAGVEE